MVQKGRYYLIIPHLYVASADKAIKYTTTTVKHVCFPFVPITISAKKVISKEQQRTALLVIFEKMNLVRIEMG